MVEGIEAAEFPTTCSAGGSSASSSNLTQQLRNGPKQSIRQRQLASIEECQARRNLLLLRQEQKKAQKLRRLHHAKAIVMSSCADEKLRNFTLSKPPPMVPTKVEDVFNSRLGSRQNFEGETPLYRLCSFLPSADSSVRQLLQVLRLSEEDRFYDLGCGDGRVVMEVVKRFGCRGTGIETNSALVQNASRRRDEEAQADDVSKKRLAPERCDFICDDIRNVCLSDAKAVFIYMPKHAIQKLIVSVLPCCQVPVGTLIYTGDNWLDAGGEAKSVCTYKTSYWGTEDGGVHVYEWRGVGVAPRSEQQDEGAKTRQTAASTAATSET